MSYTFNIKDEFYTLEEVFFEDVQFDAAYEPVVP